MIAPKPYRLTETHEADDDCWRWHCWTHNVDELRVGAPYIVCGECGHVFQTARALRKARRNTMRSIYLSEIRNAISPANPYGMRQPFWSALRFSARGFLSCYTRRAKLIHHCPHCAHDF